MVKTRRICFCMAFLPCLISGCDSRSTPEVTAAGNVRIDGQPISGALITLEPLAPTTGPKASCPIFSGSFEFANEVGLHGGNYRVRFSLMPAEIRSSIPADHAEGLPPQDAVISDRFDSRSQLTWMLRPGQPNSMDFEIEYR